MSPSRRLLAPAVATLCTPAMLAACVVSTDLDGLSGGNASRIPGEDGGGGGDGAVASDASTGDGAILDAAVDAPADATVGCTVKTTVARSPGSVAVSGGGQVWANPANASISDGVGAMAAFTTSNDQSQFLTASSFGFAIPAGAQIRGITVTVRAKATAADPSEVRDESLRLAPNGTPAGADKRNADYTSGFVTRTYGGPSDLWALNALTPALVNGAGFGLWLSVKYHSTGNASADVDAITIAVTTCE